MREIVLYIAMSLDGFIAKTNGNVDWIVGQGSDPGADNGYRSFFETVDTVVLGRITYDQIIQKLSPNVWPYEGKRCFVATRKPQPGDGRVEFIYGDTVGIVQAMKTQEGKDIWLAGGADLVKDFIRENAIDRYVITVIPQVLGEGIPLFPQIGPELKLRLIGTRSADGMAELTYIRR